MKKIYRTLILAGLMAFGFSCENAEDGPIFYYEDLEAGTYIRLVEDSEALLIDLNDLENYSYVYTVEFVDATGGASVESYAVDLTYKKETVGFRTLQASEFTVNDNGFAETTITVTAQNLLDAFDLVAADLEPKDQFQFAGEIVTPTRTFNSANSSATVEGDFFVGYFDFTLFVGCESDLEGEYSATTTTINCNTDTPGSASVDFDVEIERTAIVAVGQYEFDDWSFGVLDDCFDDDDVQTGFFFEDVCDVVSFTVTTDEFGVEWDFSSVVNGNDWEITWSNPDSGLDGVTVITFPDGIPFTVE